MTGGMAKNRLCETLPKQGDVRLEHKREFGWARKSGNGLCVRSLFVGVFVFVGENIEISFGIKRQKDRTPQHPVSEAIISQRRMPVGGRGNQAQSRVQQETSVVSSQADAVQLLCRSATEPVKPDVIDLDPYGAPSVFLGAVFAVIRNGRLLCVTCTDMACLARRTSASASRCTPASRGTHAAAISVGCALSPRRLRHTPPASTRTSPSSSASTETSQSDSSCRSAVRQARNDVHPRRGARLHRSVVRELLHQHAPDKQERPHARPPDAPRRRASTVPPLATNGPSGCTTTATTPSSRRCRPERAPRHTPELKPADRHAAHRAVRGAPGRPALLRSTQPCTSCGSRSSHSPSSRRGAARPRPGASACGRARAAGGRSPG